MRKQLLPFVLLLAAGGAAPGDCGGNAGGKPQFEEKIKPGSPLDVPLGIYQIVGYQGHVFFQGQAEGDEREVFAIELQQRLAAQEPVTVLDVRPEREYVLGHIPTAINLPLDLLFSADSLVQLPTDGTPIVVVSSDGHGAALAAGVLGAMGYPVYVLRFGMISWVATSDVPVFRPDKTQPLRGINGQIVK